MSLDIVTRYSKAELPFAIAFHSHYSRSGVNSLHYIISDEKDAGLVSSELRKLLEGAGFDNYRIFLIPADPNRALMSFDLGEVKSEYFLSVDMDEYINDKHLANTITRLVDSSPQGYINIKWLISCSDFNSKSRSKAFTSNIGKVAAKTDLVLRISGPHSVRLKGGDVSLMRDKADGIEIVHYWARSFDDILLKCIFQRFKNRKLAGEKQLHRPRRHGLPMRLKMLAYMKKADAPLMSDDMITVLSQDSLANDTARQILGDKAYSSLVLQYKKYKRQISKEEATMLCKSMGPLRLAEWIENNEAPKA